jgi:hypothetical protein
LGADAASECTGGTNEEKQAICLQTNAESQQIRGIRARPEAA